MPWQVLVLVVLVCRCAAVLEDEEGDFEEFEHDFDFGLPEEDDIEDTVLEGEEEGTDEEDEEGFDDVDLDSDEFEEGHEPGVIDKLKIAEPAVRRKPFWEAYVLEILVVTGMVLYMGNYFIGRGRNSALAQAWLNDHMDLLQANFSLVGDNGEGEEPTEEHVVKESDSVFTLWASGRHSCNGMLVQMKFHRRHDLLSVLLSLFRSQPDTVTVVFQLGEEDMDSYVLALGQKKAVQRMQKEYEDLSNYCPTVRPGSKNSLDETFWVLSEIPEATSAVLSHTTLQFLNKHASAIESLHISDQYTGFVQNNEDSEVVVVRQPQKRIQITYRVAATTERESMLRSILGLLDHVRGVHLTREAREKAAKNRARVAQSRDKLQHAQRQEAAQQRREEKKRAEKERLMAQTDPEKTRKWEEREHKKAMRRSQPKMKQMKVRLG